MKKRFLVEGAEIFVAHPNSDEPEVLKCTIRKVLDGGLLDIGENLSYIDSDNGVYSTREACRAEMVNERREEIERLEAEIESINKSCGG